MVLHGTNNYSIMQLYKGRTNSALCSRRCCHCMWDILYGIKLSSLIPHLTHLLYIKVRYHGFKALTAGLQADTYLEAFNIEKQKKGYAEMSTDSASEELV